jgi:hypothetical protein
MRVHKKHDNTMPLFPGLVDNGAPPVKKKEAAGHPIQTAETNQPAWHGSILPVTVEPLTISDAIGVINSLSQRTRSDLRLYDDRLYKSGIQSAYRATEGNKERLVEFIDALSLLFKKNEIARALIGNSGAQIEAVHFSAKKLQQAYRRRSQSKEKQTRDLATSRNYGRLAKELESLFYIRQTGRRKKRQFPVIRRMDLIKRELVQIANGLDKKDEMKTKLRQGSNLGIQAVWILNLKHNIVCI